MYQRNNSLTSKPRSESPELKLRLISAAVGLPLLGLTLFFGFWPVSVVAIAVAAVVGLETQQLAFGKSKSVAPKGSAALVGAFIAGLGVFGAALGELKIDYSSADTAERIVVVILVVLVAEFLITSRFARYQAISRRKLIISYGIIVVLAVTLLPFIVSSDGGHELLAYGILVMFAADSGAYFVGRSIGRRRMAPNVSPGKTWEGFAGGLVAAVVASLLLSNLLSLDFSIVKIVVIGLVIAALGVVGDLTESWVKRLADVKDSGGIIPGHGGILDRLDALAPIFVFIYFIV
ncbi:MAG: CDP-archaeol synthase [Chloroflexi bacterium]|nr:CDP-archaeol synthase [Chloroflexota bacterium]MYK61950.1 CDP-archaeol synthase [Chloroflexota bacterium]